MCKMSTKIKDVAKAAGVSIATVSRVLNNEKYVSKDVRDKVEKAAKALNYSPNLIAKSLVAKKTHLIGVIIPDISASFFATILSSIEKSASEKDYNLLVCNINEDFEKEKKYLNMLKMLQVDGVLLLHEKITDEIKNLMAHMGVPIVLCSLRIMGLDYPAVNIDDFKAAYDAISYLASLGHKDIAYFGGNFDTINAGVYRYNAVVKAFSDFNIELKKEYIKLGELTMENGYLHMESIFKHEQALPTAIFAASDDMAVGAINCIIDHGFSVPSDISVMGFDDSRLATSIRPALTTIHQPLDMIGSVSVKMLMDAINKENSAAREIILPHKLIERDSCKKINS